MTRRKAGQRPTTRRIAGLAELYSLFGIVTSALLVVSGELHADFLAKVVGLLVGATSLAVGALARLASSD